MQTITVDEARQILVGQRALFDPTADAEFSVAGELDLSGETSLTAISPRLRQAWSLNLEGCTHLTSLPDGLQVHRLNLNGCTALKQLPAGLVAHSLQAKNSGLTRLPDDVRVAYKIDLSDCKALTYLPDNLHTGSLIIKGCTNLEWLPDGLHFYVLDASGCIQLNVWGAYGHVEVGNLNLSGCIRLTYLPDWLEKIAQLNLRGCTELQQLPANLTVVSAIEVAESGLTAIPPGCAGAELRWRDVLVDERIAFHPETLTAQEIMDEANIERRRVMLDRMGYEAFFKEAKAKELDRDVDPGGVRRLLKVEFKDKDRWRRDEPVVCLSVICPSTARHYIIRVPPTMATCRQAAAWIAGFDNPEQYNPVQET